jgi:hypothetical protein
MKATGGIDVYTAKSSGATFKLHGILSNASTAEAVCRSEGGHMASFSSLQEQNEVEQYYLAMVGASTAHPCTCIWRLVMARC